MRNLAPFVIVFAALSPAACDNPGSSNHPVFPTAPVSAWSPVGRAVPKEPEGIHQQLLKLSEGVPELGGIYVDTVDGSFVVPVTAQLSPARTAQVREFIQNHVSGSFHDSPMIRTRLVRYSYRALSGRFLAARALLGPGHGLLHSRIDPIANVLVLGIDRPDRAGQIKQLLRAPAVADDAFAFVSAGNNIPDITLREYTRPFPGGFQIQNPNSENCSVGFNAFRKVDGGPDVNAGQFLLTAAHCQFTMGQVVSTPWGQPDWGNSIAVEIENPPFFPCSSQGGQCRLADVAVLRYNDGVYPIGSNFGFGIVARTASVNTGNITVSAVTNIQTLQTGVFVGWPVRAVGRTTGERSGYVQAICVDLYVNLISQGIQYTLLCQDQASIAGLGGDSGGPVFITDTRYVSHPAPVGIYWGRNDATGWGNYSSVTYVDAELNHGYYYF